MKKTLTLITTIIISLTLITLTLNTLPTYADDTWNTPTPTPSPTTEPTPDDGTPTAVPMPEPMEFPNPNYANPTGIPTLGPAPTPIPWSTWPIPYITPYVPEPFDAPSLDLTPFPTINSDNYEVTFTQKISKSYGLSYTKPLSLGGIKKGTKGLTGTKSITLINNIIGDISGTIGTVSSYTNWLTNQKKSMKYTGTFTMAKAPDWYAPSLPREMADVGWTYETILNPDTMGNIMIEYSIRQWAWFFGRLISMPVRFMKWVYTFWNFLGPWMLLSIWIFVMAPIVLVLRTAPILTKILWAIIRWLDWIAQWLWRIWEAIPFLN